MVEAPAPENVTQLCTSQRRLFQFLKHSNCKLEAAKTRQVLEVKTE